MDTFNDWYIGIPPVTRTMISMVAATSILCHVEIISPAWLHLNWRMVAYELELWRVVTTFIFIGPLGFEFILSLGMFTQMSRSLETSLFTERRADYVFLILYGICTTLLYSVILLPYADSSLYVPFLGHALASMLLYIWAYSNPFVKVNIMGIISVHAPYLPWVFLGFSILTHSSVHSQLLGIAIGHSFYFLEVVYPKIKGHRPLGPLRNFISRLSCQQW